MPGFSVAMKLMKACDNPVAAKCVNGMHLCQQ